MDMAVGIIIGAAFGKIIASLVEDVLMPVVSIFTGGFDVSQSYILLGDGTYESLAAAQEAGRGDAQLRRVHACRSSTSSSSHS